MQNCVTTCLDAPYTCSNNFFFHFFFTSSSFYSFSSTVISSGISTASFEMSFSLRASHFGTWNVYVSVSHPETCFGIGISRARGTNSGFAIVTFLNLVKVCASRNALATVDGNKKHKFNRNCWLPPTLLTLPRRIRRVDSTQT